MRILVVLYKFGSLEEIGKSLGSYSYFLDQLVSLKKAGVQITVLAPWVNWHSPGTNSYKGIKIIRYWPKLATRSLRNLLLYKLVNKLYIWRTQKLVERLVRIERFNLVYVRQARETGVAVARAKRNIKGTPIIFQPITTWRWHFEDSEVSWFKKLVKDLKMQKKYSDLVMSSFDYFITYNKTMQEEYVQLGADKDKFFVVPGAVDHNLFKPLGKKRELRESLGLPVKRKIILYIGRINFEEKGLGYLLQAFSEIVKNRPDAFLALVGPGTQEQLNKLNQTISDKDMSENVQYFGKKDYIDLPRWINAADVGAVPSIWYESSGRVTLDLMSCGLPVVITNTGGMPDYSVEGQTGFVVDPKNELALAKALEKILDDESKHRF